MAASAKSLSALLAQTSLEDPDEIIKAANAEIKKSKSNTGAYHAKAVALLKQDRYEDALKVFDDAPALQEKARFEYAYALYKSGEAAKAVEVAKKDANSRAMKHVLAQASYRAEKFGQAAKIYRQLSAEKDVDEEADIRINASAVDAQLEWAGKGHLAQSKKPGREDLQAFETAYNTACGCISRDELPQAEICLKRAIDLCNATTDLTDAEKEAEIMPMKVQQVYVLTRLGKVDEAEQLATTIPFAEIKELSTRYIAQVNTVAATTKHSNPYLSQRLIHSSPKPPKTDQLFSFQTHLLRQDEYVIDLMAHKVKGVESHTAKLIAASPAPTTNPDVNTAAVFNAAAHVQNLSDKAAIKEILPLLEKRPNDVGLLLTIVQLYVLTNNLAAATQLLEAFFKRLEQTNAEEALDVRHAPGLVAVLVSLYVVQGRHSHSKSGLAKSATYWRDKLASAPRALMLAAGSALLESHDSDNISSAGELFEGMLETDNTDRAAVAGLVASYAITEASRLPQELVDTLPPIERLTSGIDAAALESAGVPTLPSLSSAATTTNANAKRPAPKTAENAPKRLRIRKKRMPKDFMPDHTMDPERWLPMRDRSYYRPKGKKGKKKMEGLTQGGPVAEEKSVGGEVAKQGGGGGQAKKGKKKGKGGKW